MVDKLESPSSLCCCVFVFARIQGFKCFALFFFEKYSRDFSGLNFLPISLILACFFPILINYGRNFLWLCEFFWAAGESIFSAAGKIDQFQIWKRGGWREFLHACGNIYVVAVWLALVFWFWCLTSRLLWPWMLYRMCRGHLAISLSKWCLGTKSLEPEQICCHSFVQHLLRRLCILRSLILCNNVIIPNTRYQNRFL